jgi:hypothetical protein
VKQLLTIFSILVLFAGAAIAQTGEPVLHPEQIGSYGATVDAILVAEGGSNQTVFKTAATLGLDASSTNEAQTLTVSAGANPTTTLSQVSGVGGGVVTYTGAGGLTVSATGTNLTFTQTSGATYTGTAPVAVTGTVISLSPSGVTAGTYNNLTVGSNGIATAGSNVAYLTTEIDGSTTNEVQTITRNATTNAATLSLSGGTINVEDVEVKEEAYPTSGTTVTLTGTLPADVGKIKVSRNGVEQNYGAGKGVVSINTGTKVITFGRAFSSGEQVLAVYPQQ